MGLLFTTLLRRPIKPRLLKPRRRRYHIPRPAMVTAAATAKATAGFASSPCAPAAALRRHPPFPLSPTLPLAVRRCPPVAARRPSRLLASASPVPPPPGEEGGDSSDGDFDPLAGMKAPALRQSCFLCSGTLLISIFGIWILSLRLSAVSTKRLSSINLFDRWKSCRWC